MGIFSVQDMNAINLVDKCYECQDEFEKALLESDTLGMAVAFTKLMSEALAVAADNCTDDRLGSKIMESSMILKSHYIEHGF